MTRLPQGVVFAATFPDEERVFDYRLRITEHEGFVRDIDDPYRYGQVMGELDLHLFGEGTHYRAFEKLGSRPLTIGQSTGTFFAVWAPNADRVSVVGDFNRWHGLAHPMRRLVPNGIWELFIPGLGPGERYKYELRPRFSSAPMLKSDPYAFEFETPPATAVAHERAESLRLARCRMGRGPGTLECAARQAGVDLRGPRRVVGSRPRRGTPLAHVPRDGGAARAVREGHGVHAHRAAADSRASLRRARGAIRSPASSRRRAVTARPTTSSGSSTSAIATASASSSTGCPATSPRMRTASRRFDGTALYEHEDPRLGEHQDWGTLIFNYGRTRGPQLPREQRALLDRGVSPRRPARRRGGVDAVSRLLTLRRAVDPQPSRRTREPRGGRRSSGTSTRSSTPSIRA